MDRNRARGSQRHHDDENDYSNANAAFHSSDRPTKDEIDHAEASLQLGFEIVSERTSGKKPAGDILGTVCTAEQHNPACATAPVTDPAEGTLPSVPSAEPSADETSGGGDWPTLEIL